jgi:hypothetical protein
MVSIRLRGFWQIGHASQWAQQMFLWVTSPISALGSPFGNGTGANPILFDSTTFYDISPPGVNGSRTLVPHPFTKVAYRFAEARAREGRPRGLPIF